MFLVGQQLGQVLGLLVVELEDLGANRLDLGDLLACFEFELLFGGQFLARRDQDHVAALAHVQGLGLQHDVQCLIPGHILQAKGNRAGDGI